MLLEEARTTTDQQLGQINKLDDEAVRTVRIAFVLSGLLVGGTKFFSMPKFGLLGAFGTLLLVGSLVTSLFVYGTSKLFIGPSPDELPIDYTDQMRPGNAYIEVIGRYESGIVRNRRVLESNALFLDVSRLLLAGAIILFATGFAFHLMTRPLVVSSMYELLSVVGINT